jgi:PKD repeat protein
MHDRWPFRGLAAASRLRRPTGQSLVEFTLILPVLLLLLMGGIDFGRVFLGWVSLNNTARIAANYAAANALSVSAGNATALATYNRLVQDDAKATNCTPDDPIVPPTYDPDTAIGSYAVVSIDCRFDLITPILSGIFGGHVDVSAQSTFPIRSGIIANTTGGGGGGPAPVAAFTAMPDTGVAALTVTFADTSTNSPSTWSWDFQDDGTVDSTDQDPTPFTYTAPGTYTARLIVSNGLQFSTATHTITVTTPPGPTAVFTINPTTGTAPLVVTFTNSSIGTITKWAWDFDGDGVTDSTTQNPPARSYNAGAWVISLKVTDSFNQSSTTTQTLTVTSVNPSCKVPDFKNVQSSPNVQLTWNAAGFSTLVVFNPSRPPEYKISNKQNPAAGLMKPCSSTVLTVSDH